MRASHAGWETARGGRASGTGEKVDDSLAGQWFNERGESITNTLEIRTSFG